MERLVGLGAGWVVWWVGEMHGRRWDGTRFSWAIRHWDDDDDEDAWDNEEDRGRHQPDKPYLTASDTHKKTDTRTQTDRQTDTSQLSVGQFSGLQSLDIIVVNARSLSPIKPPVSTSRLFVACKVARRRRLHSLRASGLSLAWLPVRTLWQCGDLRGRLQWRYWLLLCGFCQTAGLRQSLLLFTASLFVSFAAVASPRKTYEAVKKETVRR